ncbi:tetratricopeptide repeat protein [Streptomyces xiaopingdaonensis]|uniref:tetratricopeptide repeat protein n=1 Tax=Streptomyces xiaopingdaonensis TaxID=1565415 RepID=UPI0002E17A44|nr:tetratricopeptide repeat protein [Streptomyces xiaopingdaonensis]
MTPPPPPLIPRKPRDARRFEPALDDSALVDARAAFAQGRWTDVRALLRTDDDHDSRGHRLTVLAGVPSSEAWSREWLTTEPDSDDAALLHACTLAHRAAERGGGLYVQAREALEAAARRHPADPSPWLALLLLLRAVGTPEECREVFDEAVARHPEHHHAHHLMVAALAEKGPAVHEFASQAAERAPADSSLALLPLVAHAERYRVAVAQGQADVDPSAGFWHGRQAKRITERAFGWWLEWGGESTHPRRLVDLNFLAYAKYHEGRTAEAAALFQRIGRTATREPWSYSGGDPHRAFRAAQRAALGSV